MKTIEIEELTLRFLKAIQEDIINDDLPDDLIIAAVENLLDLLNQITKVENKELN